MEKKEKNSIKSLKKMVEGCRKKEGGILKTCCEIVKTGEDEKPWVGCRFSKKYLSLVTGTPGTARKGKTT